jgi:hypothetical protein
MGNRTVPYRSGDPRERSRRRLILMFALLIVAVVAAVIVPKFLGH